MSDNYTLSARLAYTPSPAFSLTLQPDYLAGGTQGAQAGVLSPTRQNRQLNFSGGASVNLPIGAKGRLTGDILRTFRDGRSINYTSTGTAVPQPRTVGDFWNGSLQLSWEL